MRPGPARFTAWTESISLCLSSLCLPISLCFLSLALSGCLDAEVSDEPGYSPLVLPETAAIQSVTQDTGLSEQIRKNDGIPDDNNIIPLQEGWAHGKVTRYWDLGPDAPEYAIPVWLFRHCDADGKPLGGSPRAPEAQIAGIGHPNMIDAVPGDIGYSPFWSMVLVCVTDDYTGERITSLSALSHAEEIGLVRTPSPMPMWANCPAYLPDIRAELHTDPNANFDPYPPHSGYYKGQTAYYFHFGGMDHGVYGLDENNTVLTKDVFMTYRTGAAEPLCPPVFEEGRKREDEQNPDYAPRSRVVNVTVSSNFDAADCFRSMEDIAQKSGDSFVPRDGRIGAIQATEEYRNLAQQYELGKI